MKKHEKIDAENGTEKESQSVTKHPQNGMRGGRAECLHPAQHPLQHLTLKLLRTLLRERCLRQTKRRVRAEKVRDERVHKRQVPGKKCTEQRSAWEIRSKHP